MKKSQVVDLAEERDPAKTLVLADCACDPIVELEKKYLLEPIKIEVGVLFETPFLVMRKATELRGK